ncbi:MAG: hypothetical protein PHQ59_05465 [Candidatus Daviesbacteria bacterium]|nr:hypothetical protein [Candidatus Daviesbacteria bacterium]
MSHLPFTLLAYFLNASAVTIDKFMLTKHVPNPLIYVFYFSAFSAVALLGLPFTHIPKLDVLLIASLSTILWTTGAYFMFKGLQIGMVSRVIPIIGTLIPLFLLIESVINKTISQNQIIAVVILILGIIALTFTDWKGKITKKEVIFEVLSATFFAVSYLVLRQAYIREEFFTVLVWSRLVIVPVSILILLIPRLKEQVLESNSDKPAFSLLSKAGLLFLGGQAAGGLSEILLTFSVSLANPALVNSLAGSSYVFLLLFSLILGKKYPAIFAEKYTTLVISSKALGIILLAIGLYLLAF